MKKTRAFALAAAALAVGFFAAHLCFAQPSGQTPEKKPVRYDFGAMQQLESFVTYLNETKQTNILQRFNDYTTASLASQHSADLARTMIILKSLRDGRTNQAYDLLEGQLSGDIIAFVAIYRELPASAREQPGLKILELARDYRAKYPFKHPDQILNDGVADAFKILNEKK
jgi:hypothetical protein